MGEVLSAYGTAISSDAGIWKILHRTKVYATEKTLKMQDEHYI